MMEWGSLLAFYLVNSIVIFEIQGDLKPLTFTRDDNYISPQNIDDLSCVKSVILDWLQFLPTFRDI